MLWRERGDQWQSILQSEQWCVISRAAVMWGREGQNKEHGNIAFHHPITLLNKYLIHLKTSNDISLEIPGKLLKGQMTAKYM